MLKPCNKIPSNTKARHFNKHHTIIPQNSTHHIFSTTKQIKQLTLKPRASFSPSKPRNCKALAPLSTARNRQQNNQQPENNNEQASEHNHDQTPILVYRGEHSKVSHEKADENSRDEQSKKRNQTLCIEFDFPNPPKKVKWILTDAENDHESNVQTSVVTLGEQQTDAEKLVPETIH